MPIYFDFDNPVEQFYLFYQSNNWHPFPNLFANVNLPKPLLFKTFRPF